MVPTISKVEETTMIERTTTYSFTPPDILELLVAAGIVTKGESVDIEAVVYLSNGTNIRWAERIDASCPLIVKVTHKEKSTSVC